MIIDYTNRRVLDVLESREKEKLVEWLTVQRDAGLLDDVGEVTTDMWEG